VSKTSVRTTRKIRGRPMTYAMAVHAVLLQHYGPLRSAAKLLARATGASPRSAENWLQGLCAPRGDELISLMAECDELRDEIMRLVDLRKNACRER
jgi:hypothetical protein